MVEAEKVARLTGLTDRTFGVELELLFAAGPERSARLVPPNRAAIVDALAAVGVVCRDEHYNHETRTWWKLVSDASVRGDGVAGVELVSPILRGLDGLKEVEKVCAALAPLSPRVNESCGLHVHHGASDLDTGALKVLVRIVNRFKPIFDGLLPASRRNNTYAAGWTDSEIGMIEATARRADMASEYRITRFKALNLSALGRHGTVEFRQHSGTFDAKKVTAWIMLTQGLVEKAKVGQGRKAKWGKVKANGDGLNNLFRAAGLRTCLPHAQQVNPAPEIEERVRKATDLYRARAKKFGVIALEERSENRSRAKKRAAQTATERVASALASGEFAASGNTVLSSATDEARDE